MLTYSNEKDSLSLSLSLSLYTLSLSLSLSLYIYIYKKAEVYEKIWVLLEGVWILKEELRGIHPEERYKTVFCIPNYYYQWMVMPFELKNATS